MLTSFGDDPIWQKTANMKNVYEFDRTGVSNVIDLKAIFRLNLSIQYKMLIIPLIHGIQMIQKYILTVGQRQIRMLFLY